MIYSKGLMLAVLGLVIDQSEGRLNAEDTAAADHQERQGHFLNRKLGGSYVPINTCLTEEHCNRQREKMGIQDQYYSVGDQ